MGFIDEKEDLFNEISAIKAIQDNFPELNRSVSSFESVRSKNGNIIEVLLDLLRVMVDSREIKSEFTRLVSKTDSFEEGIKTSIVTNLLNTYTKNFNFNLPSGTILKTSLKNIDLNETLKTDPNSSIGKYYYGKNDDVDFTRFLNTVAQNGSGTWKNILDFNFTGPDIIEVSFNNNYSNKTYEDFVFDFINSVKIIDNSLLMTNLMDSIFGNVSSLTDSGYEWLLDQLKLSETINKIIDNESLTDNATYDNSFFTFSKQELDKIRKEADGMSNGGHLVDLGCGFGETFIDLGSFGESFDSLSDIRPSLVKEATNSFIDKLLDQSTVGIDNNSKSNVEFNIISGLFKNLPSILFSFSFKPQTLLMFQLSEAMVNGTGSNGGLNIPSGIDFKTNSLTESSIDLFIKKMKESVVCMVKKVYSLVVEFLFDKVKAEVLKLAAILFSKILTDQVKNYQKILTTIRNLLSQVNNIFSLINGV